MYGIHWGNGAVGLVIHEYVVGSVIQHYGSLEVLLSTPQYGFQKGLKVFKEAGYDATLKELEKNLIGKNVLEMLPAKSITHDMMKMSLDYLMFLKRMWFGKIKARGCADSRPQENTLPNLNQVHPVLRHMHYFLVAWLMLMKEEKW